MGASVDLKAWVGIGAGPAAWTAQLLLNYPIAQLTCHAGFPRQHVVAMSAISAAALCAVASGAALLMTLHRQEQTERVRFMVMLGFLTCALFGLVILATAVPPLFLNRCEA